MGASTAVALGDSCIVVFVLLFGAKKLPDAARSLGKSMRIFKSEVKEMQNDGQAGRRPPARAAADSGRSRERVEAPAPAPRAAHRRRVRPEPDHRRQRAARLRR